MGDRRLAVRQVPSEIPALPLGTQPAVRPVVTKPQAGLGHRAQDRPETGQHLLQREEAFDGGQPSRRWRGSSDRPPGQKLDVNLKDIAINFNGGDLIG